MDIYRIRIAEESGDLDEDLILDLDNTEENQATDPGYVDLFDSNLPVPSNGTMPATVQDSVSDVTVSSPAIVPEVIAPTSTKGRSDKEDIYNQDFSQFSSKGPSAKGTGNTNGKQRDAYSYQFDTMLEITPKSKYLEISAKAEDASTIVIAVSQVELVQGRLLRLPLLSNWEDNSWGNFKDTASYAKAIRKKVYSYYKTNHYSESDRNTTKNKDKSYSHTNSVNNEQSDEQENKLPYKSTFDRGPYVVNMVTDYALNELRTSISVKFRNKGGENFQYSIDATDSERVGNFAAWHAMCLRQLEEQYLHMDNTAQSQYLKRDFINTHNGFYRIDLIQQGSAYYIQLTKGVAVEGQFIPQGKPETVSFKSLQMAEKVYNEHVDKSPIQTKKTPKKRFMDFFAPKQTDHFRNYN